MVGTVEQEFRTAGNGTELADYEEVIREELERYGEDDLMQYFDGSESIQEKIQSAVVTIEN